MNLLCPFYFQGALLDVNPALVTISVPLIPPGMWVDELGAPWVDEFGEPWTTE